MSRSLAARPVVGLEIGAIRFAVRVTIVAIAALVTIGAAANAARALHGGETGPMSIALVAFAAVALAVWTAHSPLSEWLGISALLLSVVSVLASDELPGHRAQASTWVFLLTYFGIILLARRAALAWVAVGVVLWIFVAPAAGLPLDVRGSVLNMRWFSLAQLVVSAMWLWAVWGDELELARLRDIATLRAEAAQTTALRTRERVRVWRQTLVRTHETLLNDIRYVLDTPEIDRQRLQQQLQLNDPYEPPGVTTRQTSVNSLVQSLASAESLNPILQDADALASLDSRQESLLRPVFLELFRNIRRHSPASEVRVESRTTSGSLVVTIFYETGTSEPIDPSGIGTNIVLRESLAEAGGSVEFRTDGVRVHLPHAASDLRRAAMPRIDVGRVVLSAVTAGNAFGGVIFGVALLIAGGTAQVLTGITAVGVTALGAFAAVKRRALPAVLLVLGALLATAVPLLIVFYGRRCEVLDVGVNVATLSGFGLVSAIVWAPTLRWWWLGVGWGAGMVLVFFTAPDACSASVHASLVAASAPVIIALIIYLSLRQEGSRMRKVQQLIKDEVSESAAAHAALDVSKHLHSSLIDARSLMGDIASGAEMTPVVRRRLKCLDAEIRSAIQVDPDRSGSTALAARDLVRSATSAGLPVRVLAIRDSGNQRPLPSALLGDLRRLLLAPADSVPVIQVLSHGDEDTLIITTALEAAEQAGLSADWRVEFDDGVADVDFSEMAIVMVRRSSTPSRHAPNGAELS